MFLDHAPFYPGHTLIVPKQHVVEVDELDDVVAKSIMDASKPIAKAIKALYKTRWSYSLSKWWSI